MSTLAHTFLECCRLLLNSRHTEQSTTNELVKVVHTLDLSASNLAVALVFLDKYQRNCINALDNAEGDPLHYHMVIAALVLLNKFINDQSYTLKTWLSILVKCLRLPTSLAMLNQLELNFLATLNYSLSTAHDPLLWARLLPANPAAVSHLQLAVGHAVGTPLSASPLAAAAPAFVVSSPPPGLATPPLTTTLHTSPLSYTNASTPMRGPMTPVSLPPCMVGLPLPPSLGLFEVWYPSPAALTPLRLYFPGKKHKLSTEHEVACKRAKKSYSMLPLTDLTTQYN